MADSQKIAQALFTLLFEGGVAGPLIIIALRLLIPAGVVDWFLEYNRMGEGDPSLLQTSPGSGLSEILMTESLMWMGL